MNSCSKKEGKKSVSSQKIIKSASKFCISVGSGKMDDWALSLKILWAEWAPKVATFLGKCPGISKGGIPKLLVRVECPCYSLKTF